MSKKKGGKKRSSPPAAPKPTTKEAEPKPVESVSEPGGRESEPTAPEENESSAPVPPKKEPRREGAAWGKPLVTLERRFTWFELRLLVVIILLLIASMVAWVSVLGLSSPIESQDSAGTLYRGFAGAVILALISWAASKRLALSKQASSLLGVAAIVIGFATAGLWRATGVEYFGHLKNWLQEGSTLTMFGGLRGVSTRLTILLAFVGGSLAAASGKHINIDVALRFVTPKLKLPVFVLQNIATIVFCIVASVAFFEYIAITNFNAKEETSRSEKASIVGKAVSQDLFLFRRQFGFDLSATPHVLGGGKWDDESRLDGRKWNEYLESSGYRDYFTSEQVDALKAPPDALDGSRLALAIGPEGQPRNLLIRTMNLTFAVGFLFMAFRFLLRLLLVLSGHADMDAENDYDPEEDPKRHAEREKVEAEILSANSTKGGA
jgi:TRAP-type C4-dicarboxylate transport system permease small subunit